MSSSNRKSGNQSDDLVKNLSNYWVAHGGQVDLDILADDINNGQVNSDPDFTYPIGTLNIEQYHKTFKQELDNKYMTVIMQAKYGGEIPKNKNAQSLGTVFFHNPRDSKSPLSPEKQDEYLLNTISDHIGEALGLSKGAIIAHRGQGKDTPGHFLITGKSVLKFMQQSKPEDNPTPSNFKPS